MHSPEAIGFDNSTLNTLVQSYKKGEIALPDFQRDWVWDAEKVHNLIGSLIRGYPIGLIITIKADEDARKIFGCERFKTKSIKPDFKSPSIELVLDGQQRLTSILQMFTDNYVEVKKKSRKRKVTKKMRYYVDLRQILESSIKGNELKIPSDGDIVIDFEYEAEKDRMVRDELGGNETETTFEIPTTREEPTDKGGKPTPVINEFDGKKEEIEFKRLIIPMRVLWNKDYMEQWIDHHIAHKKGYDKLSKEDRFVHKVVRELHEWLNHRYKIYRVIIPSDIDDVYGIFENINTNVEVLTVFDLLVVKYAGQSRAAKDPKEEIYNLNEVWKNIVKEEESLADKVDKRKAEMVVEFYKERGKQEEKIDFVRMASLCHFLTKSEEFSNEKFSNEKFSNIRDELLAVPYEDFKLWKNRVQKGIRRACEFKHEEMPGGRVSRTQFVLLGAMFSYLIYKDEINEDIIKKVRQWFWRVALCNRYGSGGGTEGRSGGDFGKVYNWISKGEGDNPLEKWINDHKRGGLNGIIQWEESLQLLYKNGGGAVSFDPSYSEKKIKVEDHHIFPQSWCISRKIPESERDSSMNLLEMPKGIHHNSGISNNAPRYLYKTLEEQIGKQVDVDEVFEKNEIDRKFLEKDNKDGFENFIKDRKERLLKLAEEATGLSRGQTE